MFNDYFQTGGGRWGGGVLGGGGRGLSVPRLIWKSKTESLHALISGKQETAEGEARHHDGHDREFANTFENLFKGDTVLIPNSCCLKQTPSPSLLPGDANVQEYHGNAEVMQFNASESLRSLVGRVLKQLSSSFQLTVIIRNS